MTGYNGGAGYTPAPNPAFTSMVSAPGFENDGITGATAASRYVGATNSGAPVAGPFQVGDFVIARNGHVWVCTVAGSPGSWQDAGLVGGTFAQALTAQFFAALGLTGATGVTRYVGGTATGAPTTGPFQIGDYVVTRDGHVFICTAAGTPGTWRDAAAMNTGNAILIGGTKVVATALVTANSRILLTTNVVGGTPGFLTISARTAGVSFTILSSNVADTSTVSWLIIEP